MLDRLIDVLLQCLSLFKFWEVVDEYEEGIVLRLGRFQRTVGPGFHWLIPLAVDRILADNVTVRPYNLSPQCLTTKDDKTVTCALIIRARICNIKKSLLETEGVDQTVQDSVTALVGEMIRGHAWSEVRTPEFGAKVTVAARKQAFKYGIEIELVGFSDLSVSKNYTVTKIG